MWNTITSKSKLLNQCIYWAVLQSTERSVALVAHAFDPNTQEAEAHGLLSLRPNWSTERIPREIGLHRESLSHEIKMKPTENKTRMGDWCLIGLWETPDSWITTNYLPIIADHSGNWIMKLPLQLTSSFLIYSAISSGYLTRCVVGREKWLKVQARVPWPSLPSSTGENQ